jgi:hypothetical protein
MVRKKERALRAKLEDRKKKSDEGFKATQDSLKTIKEFFKTLKENSSSADIRNAHEEFKEIQSLLKQSVYSSEILLNRVNDIMDSANREKNTYQLNFSYFNLP